MAVKWNRVSGALRQVTCKGANVVGCNKSGSIYQRNYNDNSWTQLAGTGVWAAAAIDYSIWHCNAAGDIYRSNASNTGWDRMPGGAPVGCAQIDAWTRDRAVHVNKSGQFFEFLNGTWNELPGTGTHITIGADGEKWHVNSAGHIYRMLPGQNTWQRIAGSLKYIHCTDGSNVAGVNASGNMYRWNGSGWEQLNGSGTYIGSTWGNLWQVNTSDDIYQAFTT